MADAKKVIIFYDLTDGIVLDRTVFATLSSAGMAGIFAIVRGSKKRLVIVDNAATFFTSQNMLVLAKAGDNNYRLIAEQTKVTVTDSDVAAIRRVDAIIEAMKPPPPPLPPYNFVTIPNHWSVETDLDIAESFVKRRYVNVYADGTDYMISLFQLKRIWSIASKFWKKRGGINSISNVKAGSHYKTAVISLDRVTLGCQTIRRYELEQLALHLGWPFPTS